MSASVTAIVVNHNGRRTLGRAIDALRSQTVRPEKIVVVDNGSTDGSVATEAKGEDLEIVDLGKNLGLPAARNAGLARAETRYAVTVDEDIYLAPEAIEQLIEAARETGAAVTCPRFILLPEENVVQGDGAELHFAGLLTLRRGFTSKDSAVEERVEVGGASGGCYCIDREALPGPNLFDEMFYFYFEDLEFSLRTRATGHRIVFESKAVALHDRGTGTAGLSFRGSGEYPRERAYLNLRNRWLNLLLHYQGRTLVLLAPGLLLYELSSMAISLTRGWGAEWLRATRWLWSHRQEIQVRRSNASSERRVGDGTLFSGGPLPFAPGFLDSSFQKFAARTLSLLLEGNWWLARRWLRR